MKRETSELLRKSQEEALIYRRKLAEGEIHLLPEEPDTSEQKSTEDKEQKK